MSRQGDKGNETPRRKGKESGSGPGTSRLGRGIHTYQMLLGGSPPGVFLCQKEPGSRSLVSRQEAPSLGHVLDVHILWPHPQHPEAEKLEREGAQPSVSSQASGGPWCIPEFENHCRRTSLQESDCPQEWAGSQKAFTFIGSIYSTPCP